VSLAIDPSIVQSRVSGVCSVGNFITGVNSDGSVTCGTDSNSGGDITAVSVGTGLTGGGTSGAVTLAVDTSIIQKRISQVCAAGSAMRSISSSGVVTCTPDTTLNELQVDALVANNGYAAASDVTALSSRTAEGWSATNSGFVGQVSSWTDIPGLGVTINLASSALVQLTAGGVQRNQTGTCHVGYRYVLDGVAQGDPTWGQHIEVSNNTEWHAGWQVMDFATLSAGSHTIQVQARNQSTSNWCYICSEVGGTLAAYDRCVLHAMAFYQ